MPSKSTKSGTMPRASTSAMAARNAERKAAVMPARSISAGSTYCTVHARARRRISSATASRSSGLTCLESLSPAMGSSGSSTTPPTARGPASGPRPTSSNPMITDPPRSSASARSKEYMPRSRAASAASASRRRRATSTAWRTPLRVSATSDRSSTANAAASASCSLRRISGTVRSITDGSSQTAASTKKGPRRSPLEYEW